MEEDNLQINENKKIRLVYFGVNCVKSSAFRVILHRDVFTSNEFELPKDMTIEDACKIVSVITKKVEEENNLTPACKKSVVLASQLLKNYGLKEDNITSRGYNACFSTIHSRFQKITIDSSMCDKKDGVVDLITFSGSSKLYEKTKLSKRYFHWFKKDVTEKDIKVYKNEKSNKETLIEK